MGPEGKPDSNEDDESLSLRGLLNEGPEKLFESETDTGRLKCCLGCGVVISSVEDRLLRMTTTHVNANNTVTRSSGCNVLLD